MISPSEESHSEKTTNPNEQQQRTNASQLQDEANVGIGLTKSYVKSFNGIIRMLLIVCTHLFLYLKCSDDLYVITFFFNSFSYFNLRPRFQQQPLLKQWKYKF